MRTAQYAFYSVISFLLAMVAISTMEFAYAGGYAAFWRSDFSIYKGIGALLAVVAPLGFAAAAVVEFAKAHSEISR